MVGLEKNRLKKAIETNDYSRELLKEVYTKTILDLINKDEKIQKQILKFLKDIK